MPPSSTAAPPAMTAISEVVGKSGRKYSILEVLQERIFPEEHFRVCVAEARDQKWIVKDIPASEFHELLELYGMLSGCPYLRPIHDTAGQSHFIFEYRTGTLLKLGNRDLPIALTKRILKETLLGLVALHDRDIVHTDIKASNITMNWEEDCRGIKITHVQLTDLESAAHVPPPYNICDRLCGNHIWRSPEAHVRGPVNKPSDMFSFGVVCIYAVLKKLIFDVREGEHEDDPRLEAEVLERQLFWFADEQGIDGLLEHLGDGLGSKLFRILLRGLDKANLCNNPFSRWEDIDAEFRDLVGGLMNFDPAKRLTAREALAHGWFADV